MRFCEIWYVVFRINLTANYVYVFHLIRMYLHYLVKLEMHSVVRERNSRIYPTLTVAYFEYS